VRGWNGLVERQLPKLTWRVWRVGREEEVVEEEEDDDGNVQRGEEGR